MFTVCVSLVLDSYHVPFQIICSPLCRVIVDTFVVDPHSILYVKRLVRTTNLDDAIDQRLFIVHMHVTSQHRLCRHLGKF